MCRAGPSDLVPRGRGASQRLARWNAHEISRCHLLQESPEVLQVTFAEGSQAKLLSFTNQPRIS